ncbi:MAG: C_GCAxxG_C_C family protein [Muribaculaceae bacterium]|nr:C_GCAxxG_C_C family protein [Muribaculaceae bacterium]
MILTLQQRIERARRLHREGYNCAQCVVMAFDDVTGLDETKAAEIAAAMGAGMAGQRQICGTLSGTAIVNGIVSFKTPKDKPAVYRSTSELIDQFKAKNGSIVCGELLTRPDRKPCMQYIEDAITIIDNRLRNN